MRLHATRDPASHPRAACRLVAHRSAAHRPRAHPGAVRAHARRWRTGTRSGTARERHHADAWLRPVATARARAPRPWPALPGRVPAGLALGHDRGPAAPALAPAGPAHALTLAPAGPAHA